MSFSPGLAGRTMIVGDLPPARLHQEIIVEGVQRLAIFEHHVIGDVHDVADRPHAGVGEPAFCIQPGDGLIFTSRMIMAV